MSRRKGKKKKQITQRAQRFAEEEKAYTDDTKFTAKSKARGTHGTKSMRSIIAADFADFDRNEGWGLARIGDQ